MSSPKRNRARILTASGFKKLREQIRSHEVDENAGFKYTLERLGELTGLDPETVKNVLDCKGSDKRTIARCFESFGLTLAESDHIPAAQATSTADPNFVGRDGAISDLNALMSRNARVIVIQARGGVGKTTLARKYLQQEFGSFLEFPIAKETKDIASIEGLLEEKLRQLGEEPGREFLVSLDRLKRKLQAERIGILIDNLEPALDSAGKFIEAHRRYVELLRVLSDPIVQSITLITSRERLREADVTVQHYSLRSLDVQAWAQFFRCRSINIENPALAALHNAYGGNAKAMDIISGAVLEDFSGDVQAYWQANQDDLFIERDLEDLVTKQFDRLQELDPDAYKLLCRMGCYRYQDVPTVPIEGLFCLLWDVPENRHRRVIKSLQDRSLVDFEDGDFWLHPVIRAEAIIRLRDSEDWHQANQRAGCFWTERITEINTFEDALIAFEAYYHYMYIGNSETALNVILEERNNEALIGIVREDLLKTSLGNSFHRFGFTKQMIFAITQVIGGVQPGHSLSIAYNILGDLYRTLGDIKQSFEYHQKSGEIAKSFHIKKLEFASLINLGFCKLTLWEIDDSINYFEKIILFNDGSSDKDTERHVVVSLAVLAFLYSHIGLQEKAKIFVDEACSYLNRVKLGVRGTGYRLFFIAQAFKSLGEIEQAKEMYQKTISFSIKSHFSQLGANSLTKLAEIYRDESKLDLAIESHLKAIEALEKIDAKFDLSEAYYQLGITYQLVGEYEKSRANLQEAIRLFGEMEAPNQVERVRQSMQNYVPNESKKLDLGESDETD